MTNVAVVEQTDVLEERIIDAEYKIWKKSECELRERLIKRVERGQCRKKLELESSVDHTLTI